MGLHSSNYQGCRSHGLRVSGLQYCYIILGFRARRCRAKVGGVKWRNDGLDLRLALRAKVSPYPQL